MDLDEQELKATQKMMEEHPHLRGGITESKANEWAESLKVQRKPVVKTKKFWSRDNSLSTKAWEDEER